MYRVKLVSLLLCIATTAFTQKINNAYQHWYAYFGNFKVNDRIAFHLDAQFRVLNGVQKGQQYLIRPGFQYIFNDAMNATVGYAYIGTFSDALNVYIPEHRIWEQFIYHIENREFDMTNRFRIEQRNVEDLILTPTGIKHEGWKEGNRFRYMNRTLISLPVRRQNPIKPYLALQEEIFLNFDNEKINPKLFDQNRLYVGVGWRVKKMKYEVGYMLQYINNNIAVDRLNHALHLAIYQNVDFSE